MGEHCPFATVCFHAQQLVEKYLKALLAFHSVPFPKTHDLAELVSALPTPHALPVDSAELGLLTRYEVEARYPGDWEPITRQESDEAVRIARLRARARHVSRGSGQGARSGQRGLCPAASSTSVRGLLSVERIRNSIPREVGSQRRRRQGRGSAAWPGLARRLVAEQERGQS